MIGSTSKARLIVGLSLTTKSRGGLKSISTALRCDLVVKQWKPAEMASYQATVEWLVDGAQSAKRSEDVLAQLCARLVECGLPLWRVAVLVTTLHPDVMGRRFLWQRGSAVVVSEAPFQILETPDFLESPFSRVYQTRQAFRRRLEADENFPKFPILGQLRAEGATDYIAYPLIFLDGSIHVCTWSTRAPGGFTHEHLEALQGVMAPLARVAEIRALRRTAENLLSTYVGVQSGERILSGRIRKGHFEKIKAAIWLSDMRGFTALTEQASTQELVEILNSYFDCQVSAINCHGGEVLKFMGDGLLAIFPADTERPNECCRQALDAAKECKSAVEQIEYVVASELRPMRLGVALHIGEVLYGNIGGGTRLDFTCVGPAVNLVSRLERVAADTKNSTVASLEFAALLPESFDQLGTFTLRGLASPVPVFKLRDSDSC